MVEGNDITLCKTWYDEAQNYGVYLKMYYNNAKSLFKDCNSSCSHLQYNGQIIVSKGEGKSNTIFVTYKFLSNEVQVFEEYLMFGVNDLIGTIGGHSGLFIGFSFYGVISSIFGYFQRQM